MFEAVRGDNVLRARAFFAASGSAGALAAGDHLKDTQGTEICVVEALECPTLLYNGYGEHNIQGIGDKYVSFIHNVMNTDFVIGVSDRATDHLNLLFNTAVGRDFLRGRTGLVREELISLGDLGLSSIANIFGAIKYAKYAGLGSDYAILTLATDGAEMYGTELDSAQCAAGSMDTLPAAEIYGRYMFGAVTDHTIELNRPDRERTFNHGYYTWVEQKAVPLEDFDARRDQAFWDDLMGLVPVWDVMIGSFNCYLRFGSPHPP